MHVQNEKIPATKFDNFVNILYDHEGRWTAAPSLNVAEQVVTVSYQVGGDLTSFHHSKSRLFHPLVEKNSTQRWRTVLRRLGFRWW